MKLKQLVTFVSTDYDDILGAKHGAPMCISQFSTDYSQVNLQSLDYLNPKFLLLNIDCWE